MQSESQSIYQLSNAEIPFGHEEMVPKHKGRAMIQSMIEQRSRGHSKLNNPHHNKSDNLAVFN